MNDACPGGVRTCLILANGAAPGKRFVRAMAHSADVVIATDGAASCMLAMGVQPNYVVGDFDSIEPTTLSQLVPSSLVHLPDQDRCDLEKAIEHARSLGCTKVVLTGVLGKRVDHELTALSLLIRYAEAMDIRIAEPGLEMIPVTARAEIRGQSGEILSLVALAPVKGVTVTGVQWPLEAEDLWPGSRGVSNVLTENVATITVTEGCLLACHLKRAPVG